MKICLYCCKSKEEDEFTLEHTIPQFLGGAYAPDYFKTHDVCKKCNSSLGLFVDAGFEKNWFVSNHLRNAARAFFDPLKPGGLPLICMGDSDLLPPEISSDETCESWLGPLGEQIYWIRPKDKRLYWYTGGNPITTKEEESRAYFLFSVKSEKNPLLTWLTFKECFADRRVKKIMCTAVGGSDPAEIGFKSPDNIDLLRIDFFRENCTNAEPRKVQIPMYMHFDFRFLAKLGLGVAYSLFGRKALETAYAKNLYKALWYRQGQEVPSINGASVLGGQINPQFTKLVGIKNAVTLFIMPSKDGIAVNLNINGQLNWTVMCASYENIGKKDKEKIKDGIVIILYRYLQRGIVLTFPEYIAHKINSSPNTELLEIASLADKHSDYFKNLG